MGRNRQHGRAAARTFHRSGRRASGDPTDVAIDLTPSMHWPDPIVTAAVEKDASPVMVIVEYRIAPKDRDAFLTAIEELAHERRRDGAYAWGIFQDTADEGRFLETFLVDSWMEHLRQHQRVTNADRVLQEQVHRFVQASPVVTHLVSAEPGSNPTTQTPHRPRRGST
jgi:hypothetical protein